MKDKLDQIKALFPKGEVRCLTDNGRIIIEEYILKDHYGIPMFEGDQYWWVSTSDGHGYLKYSIYTDPSCIIESLKKEATKHISKDIKIFASSESASKWVKENKPKHPLYVDPENGSEFYEGEDYHLFNKTHLVIRKVVITSKTVFESSSFDSKPCNTREKCEIALAQFILEKHNLKTILIHQTNHQDEQK